MAVCVRIWHVLDPFNHSCSVLLLVLLCTTDAADLWRHAARCGRVPDMVLQPGKRLSPEPQRTAVPQPLR
jgi:hypothetical protein